MGVPRDLKWSSNELVKAKLMQDAAVSDEAGCPKKININNGIRKLCCEAHYRKLRE